jgi:hypothetical protein
LPEGIRKAIMSLVKASMKWERDGLLWLRQIPSIPLRRILKKALGSL